MIRKGSFCSHLPRGLRNFVVHQSPTGGALATRNGNEGRQREALLRRAYVGQGAPCRQGEVPSLRLRRRLQNGVENVWAGRLRRNWDCGLKQPQGRACRSSTCSAFWPQALCLGWRPLGLGFSRLRPWKLAILAPPGLPLLAWQGVLLQTRAAGTLRAGLAFYLG